MRFIIRMKYFEFFKTFTPIFINNLELKNKNCDIGWDISSTKFFTENRRSNFRKKISVNSLHNFPIQVILQEFTVVVKCSL